MEWASFPVITEAAMSERLAPIAKKLLTPDDEIGVEADPEVFIHRGAVVVPAIRAKEVEIPDFARTVLVEGDVEVDGLFVQDFRRSPVLVMGSLRAKNVYTDGCLAVMGDLTVADVFYGCCTNYCTHVFGNAAVGTLLLDRNHHYIVHGKSRSNTRIEDEVDGYDAIPEWLRANGLAGDLVAGLGKR